MGMGIRSRPRGFAVLLAGAWLGGMSGVAPGAGVAQPLESPAPATGIAPANAAPPGSAPTATAESTVRPRVCLVLSGGGARGLAHIGVLKVLERLRVPIDCIAGTSMGAVVGGLYATGMSASQIEAAMRSVDWQEAFRDVPPRRELAFRRKQDDRNYLVRLPLGLQHHHLLLPKGLIQGQKLQETLRELTLPFPTDTDFDALPTEFRAVATDLENGQTIVMARGDLAIAMRASISAPGLFAPVESQGRLLVDGGLAENLPVNTAHSMHPDLLIVSDVSFPLKTRKQLDSALSISNQMLAILVRKDADREKALLAASDIVIEPELGDVSSTDFTISATSITQGERAARAAESRLAELAVGEAAYSAYLERRAHRAPGEPPIRFVRVDAQSKRYEKTILAEMRPLIGKPLDPDAVAARITELYGLGYFETLDYSIVTARPGAGGASSASADALGAGDAGQDAGLEVKARRKSWGPNYVRFGLGLQDNFQGNSYYNAAARFLLTELNSLGAELLTDAQIGYDPKLTSEFYQPLDALRTWFVAPSARIEDRDLPFYKGNHEVADYRDREVEGDFDVGRELGNWGEFRMGLHRTTGLIRDQYGNSGLVVPEFNNGELFMKFSYDRLDNVQFPRTGQTFTLQWDANRTDLGGDFAFDKVTASYLAALSRGRNTLLLWASAGSTVDGKIKSTDVQDFYSLGGFFNLSGLAPLSLLGPDYAIVRTIYFRRIGRGGEGFFDVPIYLGASFEVGGTWSHFGDIAWGTAHKDTSVFLAFDTYLGPVYVGTGYDQTGTLGYYLFLGRTF